jgi:hypothetical protein
MTQSFPLPHRLVWLWALLILLALGLTACSQPVAGSQPRQVQCFYAGEVVFDQMFDDAQTLDDGSVKVWLGNQSAVLEGECKIVT